MNQARFDAEKALEIVLYIVSRMNSDERLNRASFHNVSKICYFADLGHIEEYGRQITNDRYVAMRNGPVPSGAYNLMKKDAWEPFKTLSASALEIEEGKYVIPLREPDLDAFSDSEIECLDDAIERYGRMSFGELTNLSHDRAWRSADENDTISIEDMVRMLPDSELILDYMQNR